mgnify:CR=1 FL=1
MQQALPRHVGLRHGGVSKTYHPVHLLGKGHSRRLGVHTVGTQSQPIEQLTIWHENIAHDAFDNQDKKGLEAPQVPSRPCSVARLPPQVVLDPATVFPPRQGQALTNTWYAVRRMWSVLGGRYPPGRGVALQSLGEIPTLSAHETTCAPQDEQEPRQPMDSMTLLSYKARVFLVLSLALVCVWAATFYRRQKQPQRLGGRISLAKLAWLVYAVFVWFILCPVIATTERVAQPLRVVLGSFAVCMWGRGVIELYMLYVAKNWRPPLGIAHDLLSLLLVVGISLAYRAEMTALTHPFDYWVLGLIGCIGVSLGLEAFYASVFHRAVAGQTTGEQGLWFVTKDDARWAWINRLTAVCNLPLYAFLGLFLGVCVGIW